MSITDFQGLFTEPVTCSCMLCCYWDGVDGERDMAIFHTDAQVSYVHVR